MISEFESLELHDTPVKSLKLTFEEKCIEFIVFRYDDNLKDYIEIVINFKGVRNFQLDYLPEIDVTYEITTFDLVKGSLGHRVNFLMLYGSPALEINMSFEFDGVEVSVQA